MSRSRSDIYLDRKEKKEYQEISQIYQAVFKAVESEEEKLKKYRGDHLELKKKEFQRNRFSVGSNFVKNSSAEEDEGGMRKRKN